MKEKLKHRIIGAVVLCALFVIFVPLIIKQADSPVPMAVNEFIPPEPPAQPAIAVDIPMEFPVIEIAEVDLDNDTILSAAPDVLKPEPEFTPIERPVELEMSQELSEETRVADSPDLIGPEPRLMSGWVVQLASFANQENAERLAEQLNSAGYRVETVTTPNSTGVLITRVVVGPEADREAAELLADDLEKLVDLKGIVLQQQEVS